MMLMSLDVLWKWLYINFQPLSNNTGGGIPRDLLVKEFLSLPEINKANDRASAAFTKILISRLLVVMHKGCSLIPAAFMDDKKTVFCLRHTPKTEIEKRTNSVPPFPEELRAQLQKEVREELLGRKSAQSLLSLASSPGSSTASTSASSPSLMRSMSLPITANFSLFHPTAALPPSQPPTLRRANSTFAPQLVQQTTNKRQKKDDDEVQIIDAPQLNRTMTQPVANHNQQISRTPSLVNGSNTVDIETLISKQIAMQREVEYLHRRDRLVQAELMSLKAEINVLRSQIDVNRDVGHPFQLLQPSFQGWGQRPQGTIDLTSQKVPLPHLSAVVNGPSRPSPTKEKAKPPVVPQAASPVTSATSSTTVGSISTPTPTPSPASSASSSSSSSSSLPSSPTAALSQTTVATNPAPTTTSLTSEAPHPTLARNQSLSSTPGTQQSATVAV